MACVLVLQGSKYACTMHKRRANAVEDPCSKGMMEQDILQGPAMKAYLCSRRLVAWTAKRLG
jgi:hypothetical protein